MQHRYVATTLGLLALGWLGLAGEAMAASPVGYWLKEDGAAKLQISQCGRNQLCSKIVWLRDPYNDQGQPLHDARNENPSLRGRTIIGLPIFQGLTPASANTWKGQIYNPEDGGTYKATLTLASSNQIILKGCMAMFLCGQKNWTRTQFNPEPEEPKQIEVKEETEEPAEPEQVVAEAEEPEAEKPEPRRMQASLGGMPSGLTSSSRSAEPEAKTAEVKSNALNPTLPPAHRDATAGYGFVLTTASPDAAPELGTASPSKMYLMSPDATSRPIQVKATSESTGSIATRQQTASSQPAQTASAATMSDAATADTTGMGAIQPGESVPMPNQRPPEIDAYAEADALANQDHLSWRERRRLRKLRRELPWLGGQEASTQATQTQGAVYQAYR
ncbi:DUF2147 domain-containing protein [Methyloligella solikamskensis]|uniref:DUF2147 domain-containing protein n=1 Tax=Methyloligella solikamskensis TaxID=1177756 RepID=A0ABW3JAW7_9HYPH